MDPRKEMVRIGDDGVAHPIGKVSSQRMRARKGAFRLMPSPDHVVFMRFVGEDGRRDAEDGAIVRLGGEITAPGTLCDIVALVAQAGWRGELVVLAGESSRSIYFDASKVAGAASTAQGERVGEVMYKLGALSKPQVDAVLAGLEPGRRFGETAIELEFITREQLFHVMGKQVEEIVYASLLVDDGMFYFLDGFDEARLASRHHLNASGLLMEGVRRMDEVKYFRERIPSDEHVPTPSPGREPPEGLAHVLAACDGRRSVAEVGRACGMPEFEVTHALFQLLQSGCVQICAPAPTSPEALAEIFNDAMRAIHGAARENGTTPALREHLAAYASSAGVYDALFQGAGPFADGTVDSARLAKNVVSLAGDDALASLSQWLYEYAAFALFDAGAALPKEVERALSQRVADRIALLAPPR